ncbi:hypothetical protein M8C21_025646 [Ambrosia artemisiifolia]|uniref:GST C-terminal domain-containing protein n=1 Tax=Ambrosia artemisiifolia TaxID=4212 RepID=A0AAD5CHA5_AMBAR|nr:hypothetical protein M8C21_025646 [Ambrosia artemisiifolia]
MKKGVEELLGCLKVLEVELGHEKPYFSGDSFGFVDIAFICYYNLLIAYGKLANFSVDKDCPKLFAWATQCMRRESVSKTLVDPNKNYELMIAYRKQNGIED